VENEIDRRAVQGDFRGGSAEVKLAWGTSCWWRAGCVYMHLSSGESWTERVGDSVGISIFLDLEASDIGTLAQVIQPGTHPEGSRDRERSSSGTSDVPAPTSADGRSCIEWGRTAWRITKGRTNLAFAWRRRRRGAGGGYFGDGCRGGSGCGGGDGNRGCYWTGGDSGSTQLMPYDEATLMSLHWTCPLD